MRQGLYIGTLSWIGEYKENADSEPQQAICIDAWRGRTSMSRELIMLKDITEICKNPFLNDDNDKTRSGERGILDALIEKGYGKEQAKAICDRMYDMTVFYLHHT